jgi:hypothetical protein
MSICLKHLRHRPACSQESEVSALRLLLLEAKDWKAVEEDMIIMLIVINRRMITWFRKRTYNRKYVVVVVVIVIVLRKS